MPAVTPMVKLPAPEVYLSDAPLPKDDFDSDPRFVREFWDEFVWGSFPGPRYEINFILEDTSPDLYVRTHDDEGYRVFSEERIRVIRRVAPRAIEDVTGHPYTGQILEGREELTEEDLVFERRGFRRSTVTINAYREWSHTIGLPRNVHRRLEGVCATAELGGWPGAIYIRNDKVRDDRTEAFSLSGCEFETLFLHELLHSMGFSHVTNRDEYKESMSVMPPDYPYEVSEIEKFHARLAYHALEPHGAYR